MQQKSQSFVRQIPVLPTTGAGSKCVVRAAGPFTIKGVQATPTKDALGYVLGRDRLVS